MDKQLVEEMAKDLKTAGLFAMDWLCAETKQIVKEHGLFNSVNHTKSMYEIMAEELIKKNYCKIPEGAVVLTNEEYDRLKCDAERYDPFWFCTFDGCEGVCSDCKDTCEMSIFVKTRHETAERFVEMAKRKGWRNGYDDVGVPHPYVILDIEELDEICKKISEGKK